MMASVTSMAAGTMDPTISPVRSPRKKMTTSSTITSVCSTLAVTP